MDIKIILDSKNPYTGQRLTTFHLVYPHSIHPQLLTHRMFSRNSSSMRAISTNRVLQQEVVYPMWTKEKKGMSGEKLDPIDHDHEIQVANNVVAGLYASVVEGCEKLMSLGIHHQNINDYLRPFLNIHTLVTATEFNNFFNLRCSPDEARPEIEMLARHMKVAMDTNTPVERYVHLPFIEVDEMDTLTVTGASLTSAARCARISYMSKGSSDDLELGNKLWVNGHLSPFEHVAFARPDVGVMCANYREWQAYRNMKGK